MSAFDTRTNWSAREQTRRVMRCGRKSDDVHRVSGRHGSCAAAASAPLSKNPLHAATVVPDTPEAAISALALGIPVSPAGVAMLRGLDRRMPNNWAMSLPGKIIAGDNDNCSRTKQWENDDARRSSCISCAPPPK